jgi:tRNA(Ile)-lysidine synthase
MESSILTVTWPKDFDMLDLKRFETEARKHRYQALGRACRDRKIQALMVAHHGDDQAETIMMRLSNNRLRSGLKGMQSVEWIPECEGIYGVHHSGKNQRPDLSLDIPYPVEQGGIQILRPLLAFEKSRLVATCEDNNVEWAEDRSNQNQTLTSRNAIRHIYRNHKLPEALSIQSLVDLSSRMQKRIADIRAQADRLFDQSLIELDIQIGSLLVRFPPYSSLLDRPVETEADKYEARDVAYCLLERVAELVTSNYKRMIGQLAARVDNIYPEFLTPEELEEVAAAGEAHFRDNFTVYHVWWRQWDKSSPFEDNFLPSDDVGSSIPHPKEWLLTRQTLEYGEAKKPSMQIIVPPSQILSLTIDGSTQLHKTYQLFDGRFWIKLHNYTHDTLIVRMFEKEDMRHLPTTQQDKAVLRNELGPRPERFITAALALLKPSDIRFTLPAVFRRDGATGKESLVGFPTLNVRMNGFGAPEGVCDWSVRYKKIDFGSRTAGDIIVPGTRNSDIVAEEKRQRMANKSITRLRIRRNRVVADQEESFTGYKRGKEADPKSYSIKRERKRRLQYTQRPMVGEEIEGLEFLQEDVEKVENESREWMGGKKKWKGTLKGKGTGSDVER